MLLSLLRAVWVDDSGYDIADSAVRPAIARVINTIKLIGTKPNIVFPKRQVPGG